MFTSKWKLILSFVLAVFLCFGIFIFLLGYAFESHHRFSKTSLAYIILLDDEIKNIPVVKNNEDLIFNYVPNDGPSVEINEVLVLAKVFEKKQLETIDYFKKLKYNHEMVCDKTCFVKLSRKDAVVEIYQKNEHFVIQKSAYQNFEK